MDKVEILEKVLIETCKHFMHFKQRMKKIEASALLIITTLQWSFFVAFALAIRFLNVSFIHSTIVFFFVIIYFSIACTLHCMLRPLCTLFLFCVESVRTQCDEKSFLTRTKQLQ